MIKRMEIRNVTMEWQSKREIERRIRSALRQVRLRWAVIKEQTMEEVIIEPVPSPKGTDWKSDPLLNDDTKTPSPSPSPAPDPGS